MGLPRRREWFLLALLACASWIVTPSQAQGRCPTLVNFLTLEPMVACLLTVQLTMTADEAIYYFENKKELACVETKEMCLGLEQFASCTLKTEEVVGDIIPSNFQGTQHTKCENFFGAIKSRCSVPFGEFVGSYCKPVAPVGLIVGGIIGGIALILVIAWICVRTARSIAMEHEIEQAVGGPPPGFANYANAHQGYLQQQQQGHYPPPREQPQMMQQQKPPTPHYHGTRYNPNGGWDSFIILRNGQEEYLGTYVMPEDAAAMHDARARQLAAVGLIAGIPVNFGQALAGTPSPAQQQHYFQQQQLHYQPQQQQVNVQYQQQQRESRYAPPQHQVAAYSAYAAQEDASQIPLPSVQRTAVDDGTMLARRKQELIHFYNFYDPEGANIEERVENLFAKYSFLGICRAIRNKYGLLPMGWNDEYSRMQSERTFAASVAGWMGFGGGGGASRMESARVGRMPEPAQVPPSF